MFLRSPKWNSLTQIYGSNMASKIRWPIYFYLGIYAVYQFMPFKMSHRHDELIYSKIHIAWSLLFGIGTVVVILSMTTPENEW